MLLPLKYKSFQRLVALPKLNVTLAEGIKLPVVVPEISKLPILAKPSVFKLAPVILAFAVILTLALILPLTFTVFARLEIPSTFNEIRLPTAVIFD